MIALFKPTFYLRDVGYFRFGVQASRSGIDREWTLEAEKMRRDNPPAIRAGYKWGYTAIAGINYFHKKLPTVKVQALTVAFLFPM